MDALLQRPIYVASDDVGFNGQQLRKDIFNDLLQAIHFECIIETGTFVGDTTGYMTASSRLPIHTTEANPRFHAIAKMRLAGFSSITYALSDSRQFLRSLADSPLVNQCAFFYLDAHWHEDLPLRDEIGLIATNWRQFVIMIDDFQVPGDDGYGYDRYGRNRALTLDYISDLIRTFDLVPYFPSLPSRAETGSRRGCVVLVRQGDFATRLSALACLTTTTHP